MNAAVMTTLSDLARRIGGRLKDRDAGFLRVVSDTRQLQRGDLFVAIRGEHFDGHDYVRRAFGLGASGALVARPISDLPFQVVADDTSGSALPALQRFAESWRRDFDVPVIGITGSNGKTTTRQLLAAVLAARGPVLATAGNLNNQIGVPLTLLRLHSGYRNAVIEMGANHAGEIAMLASWSAPDIGVITASGDDHLEGFGSPEVSARTNGEVLQALSADGVAVINADDEYAALWRTMSGRARILEFGVDGPAEISAETVQLNSEGSRFTLVTPGGRAPVQLSLPGRHNVSNALAAAAAATALEISPLEIAHGLATAQPVSGRGVWHVCPRGAWILDDSYNANPTSMRAALQVLSQRPRPRWAVLGDMAELGAQAEERHRECGISARHLGIERLFAVGPLSLHTVRGFGDGGHHFGTIPELVQALQTELPARASLLVKGSRSARMERVVAALCEAATEGVH